MPASVMMTCWLGNNGLNGMNNLETGFNVKSAYATSNEYSYSKFLPVSKTRGIDAAIAAIRMGMSALTISIYFVYSLNVKCLDRLEKHLDSRAVRTDGKNFLPEFSH